MCRVGTVEIRADPVEDGVGEQPMPARLAPELGVLPRTLVAIAGGQDDRPFAARRQAADRPVVHVTRIAGVEKDAFAARGAGERFVQLMRGETGLGMAIPVVAG